MKKLITLTSIVLFSLSVNADSFNIDMNSVPKNKVYKKIGAFSKKETGALCFGAKICTSDDNQSIASYEDKVWGSPKYLSGEVVFSNGKRNAGKVVLFSTGDWNFTKGYGLFIPKGKTTGVYFDSTTVVRVKTTKKKDTKVYDRFDNFFLERLISGKYRLSYNPAANSSKPLVGGFISDTVLEEANQRVAAQAIAASIKDGNGVSASVKNGQDIGQGLTDIANSISISEKEYLLFNETTGKTVALKKDNYKEKMSALFSQCSGADAKKAKKLSKKIKRVKKAVNYLNENC